MKSSPDWHMIRHDFENGLSLRQLAQKYTIGKSTIERHAKEGQWDNGTMGRDNGTPTPTPAKVTHLPMPDDALSIARSGLSQLARYLQTDITLEIKEHKSLSDALAQYVKVLLIAPQQESAGEQEEGFFIPLSRLLPSTRKEIRRLLVEDEQEQRGEGVS